MNKLKTLKDAE